MKVSILEEHGYNSAMLGLSLSYTSTIERSKEIAVDLAYRQGGHNKFLESIYVWLDVTAPRFWWQEADTYRISTKQSESTMHTLCRRHLTQSDFEIIMSDSIIHDLNNAVDAYNFFGSLEQYPQRQYWFEYVKNNLPEGFLQRRIWTLDYKCIQNIVMQRHNHRLIQWQTFCEYLKNNLEHKEFIERLF